MLRAIFVGLLSIGCAAETYVTDERATDCGWGVAMLVSFDADAGDCEWSARTLDDSLVRLRSVDGQPSDPVPLCEVTTYREITGLRPLDVVEAWVPGEADPDVAGDALDVSPCR